MGRRSKALFLTIGCLLALGARLAADGLPVPEGLQFHAVPGGLTLSWQGVEGAGLYRVAIFDEPEADGKRPLLAAVWVRGTQYAYGKTFTVPKAGKYPSTKPLPLPAHRRLRVMVAAAAADGSDKGDWAGLDVETAAQAAAAADDPAPTASPSPSPVVSPSASPTPGKATQDAELEVQGAEEFKQSPDAAVLDVDDSAPVAGAAAVGAATAGAAVPGAATAAGPASGDTAAAASGSAASVVSATAVLTDQASPVAGAYTLGEAKGLNSVGRFEQAESAYRAILDKDPNNADAWEGLGDSYAGRKMKLEAKESYEKALSLDSTKNNLKEWIDKNVRR